MEEEVKEPLVHNYTTASFKVTVHKQLIPQDEYNSEYRPHCVLFKAPVELAIYDL